MTLAGGCAGALAHRGYTLHMHRSFALHCAWTALVMALGACDFYDGPSHRYRNGDYGNTRYERDPCARYDSCTTCTPVRGCGWCTTPRGSACFSDPLECADS